MHTLLASVVIPNGTNPKPVVTLVFPSGEIERVTLYDHDWGNDSWFWRGGEAPESLMRYLRTQHYIESISVSQVRNVYTSPKDVGIESNEEGRLQVYEIDYVA